MSSDSRVIDILDREIEFILVSVMGTTILSAAIGQNPVDTDPLLVEERDHPVVEDVGRGQRGLAGVEFGEAHLGIGAEVLT